MTAKISLLREIYNTEVDLADSGMQTFVKENRDWLIPYAVFCVLRDKGLPPAGTPLEELAIFANSHEKECGFFYFVQYHLHLQLLSASR